MEPATLGTETLITPSFPLSRAVIALKPDFWENTLATSTRVSYFSSYSTRILFGARSSRETITLSEPPIIK
jgi:hypothetical protein